MPESIEPIPAESVNNESIISQADVSTDQSVPKTAPSDNSSVNSILMNRRQFFQLAAATVVASAVGAGPAITSLLDPKTSSIPEDNVTPTPLTPEVEVTVNPNKQIQALIGINPQDFQFTEGRNYTGTVDVEPPEGKPIIVHFGQYHGVNDLQINLSLEESIVASQRAIESMICKSNITHVFDEGVDDELIRYLTFVRAHASRTLAPIKEDDSKKWKSLYDGYSKIYDDLIEYLGFDLKTFNLIEASFGGDLRYYYFNEAQSALDYLLLETAKRLNAGVLPLPKPEAEITSQDDHFFNSLDKLNATLKPYMELGATRMLFMEYQISLHSGESTSYLDNKRFRQALYRIAEKKLSQNNSSEEERKKSKELIETLGSYDYREDFVPREKSVLAAVHSSAPFKSNENIGIVYGSAHDFSEEFKDEFPPGTAGLITIKPKL